MQYMSRFMVSELISGKDRLIFPLDFPSNVEALRYMELLDQYIGVFKVGLELFVADGLRMLSEMRHFDAKVFLDLKFHDIPETMKRAIKVILEKDYPVDFLTVHCDGGGEFLKDVVKDIADHIKVIGVTVLTSLDSKNFLNMGIERDLAMNPSKLVLRKAEIAYRAGFHGVVCSGHEIKAVKEKFGIDFLVISPGIRPRWSIMTKDDQKRIVTPFEAITNGADYIVVGRPIRDSGDPVVAAQKVVEEIEEAQAKK